MASIPSFRQQNRIGVPGGSEIVDPRQARRSGEDLARLGQSVAGFSQAVDEYMQKKREVDYALKTSEAKQKLTMAALQGEEFAKTNPEGARDGSSAQEDFTSVFGEVKDSVLDVQDPRLKAKILAASTQIEGSYRNKLLTYQIDRHNSYVLEKSQDVMNDMSAQVMQDPSLIGTKLKEFDEMAASMPYTGANHEKFIQAGRRGIITAGLESFAQKGDFDTAKKILNESAAASLFSTKERKELSAEFDRRRVQASNEAWNLEQRKRTRLNQERIDMQEKTEADLFKNLIEAKTPQEEAEVYKDAQAAFSNRMLSRASYNALRTDQRNIGAERSSNLKGEYTIKYLSGTPFAQIKPQVIAQMQSGNMSHKDGFALLQTLSKQAKRENLDPQYKQEKANAKEYIKAAVTPTGLSAMGSFFRSEEKQQLVKINEKVLELEAAGKSPMESARQATAEVLGVENLRNSVDPKINHINDDDTKLEKYGILITKKYKLLKGKGQVSEKIQREYIQTLQEIEYRREYLKQKKIRDSILNIGGGK